MKKKLIYSTAIAALFSASAVLAGGPEMVVVAPSPFDGFYVGGDGSFHHTGFDIDGSLDNVFNNNGVVTTTNLATQNGGDSDTTGYYGVNGGWGKVFMNRWYAGVIGFADFGNADGSISNTTQINPFSNNSSSVNLTNSAHIGTTYGVAAKLGVLLSQTTLGYALLGAEWADVKSTVSSTFVNSAGQVTNIFPSTSNSSTNASFLWGFGVDQFFWRDVLSVFAQYTYANFDSVNANGQVLVFNNDRRNMSEFLSFNNNSSADVSAFTGGLEFHFGHNLFGRDWGF